MIRSSLRYRRCHGSAGRDRIDFREDNGEEIVARWFDLADLDLAGQASYPTGLKDLLLGNKRAG